jgi:hypothetical protein
VRYGPGGRGWRPGRHRRVPPLGPAPGASRPRPGEPSLSRYALRPLRTVTAGELRQRGYIIGGKPGFPEDEYEAVVRRFAAVGNRSASAIDRAAGFLRSEEWISGSVEFYQVRWVY